MENLDQKLIEEMQNLREKMKKMKEEMAGFENVEGVKIEYEKMKEVRNNSIENTEKQILIFRDYSENVKNY
jgi:hypothetical protein